MDNILFSLENILGTSRKSSSGERLFHCPFCYHHKPKLSINFGRRSGFWKCWVCGVGGKSIKSLLYKLDYTPKEIGNLLEDYDPNIEYTTPTPTRGPIRLPKDYQPLWRPNTRSFEYKNALSFLRGRGVTVYDVYRYQLGYCETGPYQNRIIIPSYDNDYNLNYFVSRSYYESFMPYKLPDVSKNVIIFENLINWNMPVVLVEGVFDAMAVKRNAIPILGKFLSSKLIQTLITNKPPKVFVMLDDDAREDAIKIERYLRAVNINSKLVTPTNKDASEMGTDESWRNIDNATESSFVDVIQSKLNTV